METKSTEVWATGLSKDAYHFGDNFIDQQIKREVFKRNTPIGIISSENATLLWQVKSLGIVKWVVSPTTPKSIQYQDDAPRHFDSFSPGILGNTEVIVVKGGAMIPNELWFCSQAKIVLKFDPMLLNKPRSGRSNRKRKKFDGTPINIG